ncbi:MAG TPA: hypothetical protein VEY12_11080 [Thermoplasmata archaeon]|nr:hypothetical protein [Thermoplasmata archaeon]
MAINIGVLGAALARREEAIPRDASEVRFHLPDLALPEAEPIRIGIEPPGEPSADRGLCLACLLGDNMVLLRKTFLGAPRCLPELRI